jgi:hypothetical protein
MRITDGKRNDLDGVYLAPTDSEARELRDGLDELLHTRESGWHANNAAWPSVAQCPPTDTLGFPSCHYGCAWSRRGLSVVEEKAASGAPTIGGWLKPRLMG